MTNDLQQAVTFSNKGKDGREFFLTKHLSNIHSAIRGMLDTEYRPVWSAGSSLLSISLPAS